MDPHPDLPNLQPATPVMVEWWSHRLIPSQHYAVMVPYKTALHWYRQGVKMVCHTIDEQLLQELERRREDARRRR